VSHIEEQIDRLRRSPKPFELVVGIGGGSVLDVAKLLAALLPQKTLSIEDLLAGKATFEKEPLPFVAIPTTAGTGSEVTLYASLEDHRRMKVSAEHRFLFPRVALIDPLLTHSMDPYLTAVTGFDALSHAIEALWSRRHNPFSDTHAFKAVQLIGQNLEKAVRSPQDAPARAAMAWGSCEAGLAISHTRTTAVHAVSYPLTTRFGIVHGHSCALTLASFILYNESVLTLLQIQALKQALGVSSIAEASETIQRLMEAVRLERRLSALGLKREDLAVVVSDALQADRMRNNPREVDGKALSNMLEQIY